MGDAGIAKENDILKKYNLDQVNFLKVGHHGSDTSSGANFINQINPLYSLVSVGEDNRYGHPSAGVLKTLQGSNIYRTDLNGTIRITIFPNNKYKVLTSV